MRERDSDMDWAANSDELLTVSEVAARLRVKSSWVYQHAGELGAYRLGKYVRFSWSRVLDRLEHTLSGSSHVGSPTQRPIPSETKAEP